MPSTSTGIRKKLDFQTDFVLSLISNLDFTSTNKDRQTHLLTSRDWDTVVAEYDH